MARTTKVNKQAPKPPVQDEHGDASTKRFTAEMRVIVTRNKPRVLVDEFDEESAVYSCDQPVFH